MFSCTKSNFIQIQKKLSTLFLSKSESFFLSFNCEPQTLRNALGGKKTWKGCCLAQVFSPGIDSTPDLNSDGQMLFAYVHTHTQTHTHTHIIFLLPLSPWLNGRRKKKTCVSECVRATANSWLRIYTGIIGSKLTNGASDLRKVYFQHITWVTQSHEDSQFNFDARFSRRFQRAQEAVRSFLYCHML